MDSDYSDLYKFCLHFFEKLMIKFVGGEYEERVMIRIMYNCLGILHNMVNNKKMDQKMVMDYILEIVTIEVKIAQMKYCSPEFHKAKLVFDESYVNCLVKAQRLKLVKPPT